MVRRNFTRTQLMSLQRPHLLARRALLGAAFLAAAFGLSIAGPASAQQKFSDMELMANEALPDVVQGKADAPITMIEYASMTCSHCAHFHETVYPKLLKDYIDTGKVRFILREFPLDPLATAGFMLARCAGPDKRAAIIDLLFDKQQSWAFVDKPLEALSGLLRQTGMSQESFEKCLNDQKLYDQVNQVRERAGQVFGVTATPTFFVNGTKVTGELTPDSLGKILDPLLANKGAPVQAPAPGPASQKQ
jgi:protein-disulfide isomerase